MSSSILKILPNPPPATPSTTPPAPAAETSASQPASGFSQELKKAKSKPAAAPQPKPAAPAASNSSAKKANPKSALGKDNSKSQQKQQNAPESAPESTAESDPKTQPQPANPDTNDSDQPNQADDATDVDVKSQAAASTVLAIPAAPVASKTSAAKTTNAKSNQAAAIASANSASATAGKESSPAPVDPPASNSDSANNSGAQQAAVSSNPVTPQPSNSTVDSTAAESETDAPLPAKAKVIAMDSSAQAADQSSPDSSIDASPPSTSAPDLQTSDDPKPTDFDSALQSAAQVLPDLTGAGAHATTHTASSPAPTIAAPPPSPVAQFAETNQPAIVSTIHGSLLPDGGTMNIALNPPDLGAMQITVRMESGAMSASFQTTNDQATRLLTHSLGQLKNALEMQGVSVDRLHVHQVSNAEAAGGKGGESESKDGQSSSDGRSAQQEQQRRDTLRRMWRRARGERDPLDLVA
jgi:flagellar hook-length control protein FliK